MVVLSHNKIRFIDSETTYTWALLWMCSSHSSSCHNHLHHTTLQILHYPCPDSGNWWKKYPHSRISKPNYGADNGYIFSLYPYGFSDQVKKILAKKLVHFCSMWSFEKTLRITNRHTYCIWKKSIFLCWEGYKRFSKVIFLDLIHCLSFNYYDY